MKTPMQGTQRQIDVSDRALPSGATLANILEALRQDAKFYHTLRFPGRPQSLRSRLQLALSSRGLVVLAAHRFTNYCAQRCPTGLREWVLRLPIRILVYVGGWYSHIIAKCDILPSTRLEGGVYLSDRGHIVLGARRVGRGTIIHERVTIGMALVGGGKPEIGRNVWIGPDCVLHGNIRVGDGVTVLPQTALTKGLPGDVVVEGNPARIIRRGFVNSALRSSLDTDSCNVLMPGPKER